MKRVDELLDEAADLFDTGRYHWIQGEAQDGEGGICMIQAVYIAAGCDRAWLDREADEAHPFFQADEFMTEELGEGVPAWNDRPGRAPGEVVDKLRELAKLAHERYQEVTQR